MTEMMPKACKNPFPTFLEHSTVCVLMFLLRAVLYGCWGERVDEHVGSIEGCGGRVDVLGKSACPGKGMEGRADGRVGPSKGTGDLSGIFVGPGEYFWHICTCRARWWL